MAIRACALDGAGDQSESGLACWKFGHAFVRVLPELVGSFMTRFAFPPFDVMRAGMESMQRCLWSAEDHIHLVAGDFRARFDPT